MALPCIRARRDAATSICPRWRAQRLDALVERPVGALGGIGRERAGDERRLEHALGLEQAGQRQRGRDLRAVEKRQTLLRAENERRKAGSRERRLRRNARAVDEELADAHQGRRHVRERREIAGRADRALAGNDRDQVRFEAAPPGARWSTSARPRRPARGSRASAPSRGARPATGSGSPTPAACESTMLRWSVARSAVADAHARELSEAGVDAVDRLALGDDGLDGPGAGLDGGAAILIERDRLRRNRPRASRPGQRRRDEALRFGHCPLQMRA